MKMKIRKSSNTITSAIFVAVLAASILFGFVGCKSLPKNQGNNQGSNRADKNLVQIDKPVDYSLNGNRAANKDFEYLKTYLTQCYVGYDEAKKNGFDVDSAIRKMKWHYTMSRLSHKQQKKEKREQYTFYNGVDNWAMSYGVGRVLHAEMEKAGIKDVHFAVYGDKNFWNVSPKLWPFFSELYFEKQGDEFFVCSSSIEEIKSGMKFSGDVNNLYKCLLNGKEVYQFIALSKINLKESEINLNGKKFMIPVSYDDKFKYKNNHIGFEETEDTIYISLSDCNLGVNDNKAVFDKMMERLDEVCGQAKNSVNKKNVILDLRGNGGGYRMYPEKILKSVFYGNSEAKSMVYTNFTNHFDSGTLTLISKEIAWKVYQHDKATPGFSEENVQRAKTEYEELVANPKRVYDGLLDPVMQELPQVNTSDFKGKIYVLIDTNSASAAELTVAFSYLDDKDKVVLIGTKSAGCIEYGGRYEYELPYSKVKLSLCRSNMSRIACLAQNPHWHGDTKGFYPDYWCQNKDLLNTLISLTGDKNLKTTLSGLENGLK